MFNLDIQIFNFFYNHCKTLGDAFGIGAGGGLLMYASFIIYAINIVTTGKKK